MVYSSQQRRAQSGYSLLEVMVAGGLITFIAVALLPAVFSVADNFKSQNFKAQCTSVIRAKMQEYINGVVDTNTLGASYSPTGFEYTKSRYQTYQGFCSLTPSSWAPGFRESVFGNAQLPQASVECVPGTVICSGTSHGVMIDSTTNVAVMPGFQLWVMLRQYNPRILQTYSAGAFTVDTDGTHNGQPARSCPPAIDSCINKAS